MTETIFVALLDEGVNVWRPVEAEHLGDGVYLIVDQPYDSDVEKWKFKPGERVRTELVSSADGVIRVAATREIDP